MMNKLCKNCGKPLIKSIFSEDHKYKTCPKCSALNGEEHIFLPYPYSFGTTNLRKTANNPDGSQSYCITHRSHPENNHVSMNAVKCSDMMKE